MYVRISSSVSALSILVDVSVQEVHLTVLTDPSETVFSFCGQRWISVITSREDTQFDDLF